MRLSSDFYLMRWSLLAACLTSLGGAALIYSSETYVHSAQENRRNAQNRLNDTKRQLDTAREDQKNMAIYAGEYGALLERNIIGDGQRLDWMEGLENLRRKKLATDFHYSIAPQKPFTAQPPIERGNFNIGYSEMKLQLDLLHEGQLLDFFAALHDGIKGWYQLEGCTLERTARAPTGEEESKPSAAVYLKAECNGGWITLKNRSAQ